MTPNVEVRFEPKRFARRWLGPLFAFACLLATTVGIVFLVVLLGSVIGMVVKGTGHETTWELLSRLVTNVQSGNPSIAGYRVGLAGTLWLLGIVLCVALPIGVGAAVFLEEYVPPGRLRRAIQTNIGNLAAVPSIVYGLLGLALFQRGFGFSRLALGPVALAGGLTLSLLVLPIVVIATQEALRTVPNSLRQAALALGASRWQVIRDHVVPAALPGILTGAILSLSRAIGETAPLLMVGAAAAYRRVPTGPLSRYSALPVEIYNFAKQARPEFKIVTAGGILLLLALLLTMNAVAIVIRNRSGLTTRG